MKNKIPILLFLGILLSKESNALTTENLMNILAKYCIPREDSNCNPLEIAKYNKGFCVCSSYYAWDSSVRTCKQIKCPYGYTLEITAYTNCPYGYGIYENYFDPKPEDALKNTETTTPTPSSNNFS